jgi:hypothetical protein
MKVEEHRKNNAEKTLKHVKMALNNLCALQMAHASSTLELDICL